MKQKLLLIIAVVLLLTFTVSLTSCGNVSAETPGEKETVSSDGNITERQDEEITPPETDAEETDSEETDETEDVTSTETDPGATTLPELVLFEPDTSVLPNDVELSMPGDCYAVIENAEGELLYHRMSGEDTMELIDWQSIAYAPIANSHDIYTVKYSDSFKFISDSNITVSYKWNNGSKNHFPWIGVRLTEGENTVLTIEEGGYKVVFSGGDLSYDIDVPLYYYEADADLTSDYVLVNGRIDKFSVEGRTNGTVTLEKKEDGWYLSGAEGEITLRVQGDEGYAEAHSEMLSDRWHEISLTIDAPADGVIHIEEYIPEVQEMYR